MGIILLFVLLAGAYVLYAVYQGRNSNMPELTLLPNWDHYFSTLQFSSQEFYDSVEKTLKEREIPDTMILRVEFFQHGSMMDKRRTYLRVKSGAYSFDICAAPYGTGFFVSSWLGEDIGCLMRILFFIPLIGSYFKRKLLARTYYNMDTESMFRQAVHEVVLQTIDEITTQKGLRALSENERQFTSRNRR